MATCDGTACGIACVAGTLDCDGNLANGCVTPPTFFRDGDGDGYGRETDSVIACTAPPGYAAEDGDCDDTTTLRAPMRAETCDGIDNDCDAQTDEGVMSTFFKDNDRDTWGIDSAATNLRGCSLPSGYAMRAGDCDDNNASAKPGQTQYFDAPRANGSYDYNCNNTEEKRDTVVSAGGGCTGCMLSSPGWLGSVPACGVEGSQATCEYDPDVQRCVRVGVPQLQACR